MGKMRFNPKDTNSVHFELLLEILTRVMSLEDAFINLYSAEKDSPSSDLRDIIDKSRLEFREQVISHLYENFGSIDLDDIVDKPE